MLIKSIAGEPVNKPLLSFINIFLFLLLFQGAGISSEVKREVLRFSSDIAQIKKNDGILHLSGEVKISYGQYEIRSDLKSIKSPIFFFTFESINYCKSPKHGSCTKNFISQCALSY